MEWMELVNLAYEIKDELNTSEPYLRVMEMSENIQNDETVQSRIREFNKMKDRHEDVSKYGKHHPDLSKVRQQFADAKTALYSHPLIVSYFDALRAYNESIQTLENGMNDLMSELLIDSKKSCAKE